jgi:type IV secretory pathway VirB2 component (pilin)
VAARRSRAAAASTAPPAARRQPAQPLLAQLRGLLGIRAFLLVCLACGLGGIAGYGYGIWGRAS